MDNGYSHSGRGWVFAVLALILVVLVGAGAYNAGVSHAMVTAARSTGTAPVVVPYYGFHPFGFFFPLLFFFLFFGIARFLFWGGPWRRRWYGYGHPYMQSSFEEWHRQAHERMKNPPTNV